MDSKFRKNWPRPGLGQLQYSQIIKRNLDLIKFDNVDREPNQTNFLSPSLKFQNRTDYNDQPVSKMVSESWILFLAQTW